MDRHMGMCRIIEKHRNDTAGHMNFRLAILCPEFSEEDTPGSKMGRKHRVCSL